MNKIFYLKTSAYVVLFSLLISVIGVPSILSSFVEAAALTTVPTSQAAQDKGVTRSQLSATATTVTIAPIRKYINGVKTTGGFDTSQGFIMITDQTGRTEFASYGNKSVSSLYVTTLSNMRRGLDPRNPGWSSGTGMVFDAGAIVQVVDWPVFYNYALYLTNVNTLTGSGQITSNQTNQAAFRLNTVTTAQRDAFSRVGDGDLINNSTTGTFQQRIGGAWLDIGTSATVNASETVSGKVQLGTIKDQSGSTVNGSTGAPTVVQTRYLTSTGGTSSDYGRIATLNIRGVYTGSVLATNARNYISSGSVTLASRSLSGSYSLGASQQFVPLAPIGSIMMWPTDTAPAGWLLADGKCHTKTGTGAALFAVIGTTFTTSCPTGTFAVPDMRGRFPLGQDDMGGASADRVTDTRADTIGSSSGSQVISIPNHTHTLSPSVGITNPGAGSNWLFNTSSPTTGAGGASTPNGMNPYLTLNYIIRSR